MDKLWPMQLRDMMIAERIMSQFQESEGHLKLFELVVDIKEKSMDYKISRWVLILISQFQSLYGREEGAEITRRIISNCLREHETLH